GADVALVRTMTDGRVDQRDAHRGQITVPGTCRSGASDSDLRGGRRRGEVPVAGVEAMQVVSVEAIAEIGGDRDRLERPPLPQPARDCAIAVDALPRPLVPAGELRRTHLQRLEHDVLAIVELPVARENASLL